MPHRLIASSPVHPHAAGATETLMQLIGHELGRMHRADIIHGDLTTSNIIVRRTARTTTTSTTRDVGAEAEIVSGRPSPGKHLSIDLSIGAH